MTSNRVPRLSAAVLLGAILITTASWRSMASGTISGVVFEDFNGNGLRDTTTTIPNNGAGTVSAAIDRGVGGVTVTVYDAAGVVQGTATSAAANGSYSIAATGTGPYRVEFTGLPAGYYPSRVAAGPTGNSTTVQFVPDGNTGNVNLAILDPANFCQNNPQFVTACYVFGAYNGPNSASPVVVDFPYSAGANSNAINDYFQPTTHTLMVPNGSVGTVYGMAYSQQTNTVYASAYMKKHAGFGPNGTGAIYAINPTTGAATLFADLNAIAGTGPDLHDLTDFNHDNGNQTWDAVGKVGIGGLEISPNGAFVYAVNLFDRRVWEIPTAGGAPRSVAIPVPATAVPSSGADLRPFALQYFRGRLYLGMVNSAESTQARANLRAYVYALDPVTLSFGGAPLLDVSLVYPRGLIQTFAAPPSAGEWLPWSPVFANNWGGNTTTAPDVVGTYPQPMLSSLSFDVDGNVVLGFRDRAGDQFGYFAFDDPTSGALYQGVTGGDTLLAELNVKGDLNSGWTLESNARTTSYGPTAGAGNNQGPGGGEYFFRDDFNDFFSGASVHQETHGGAVLQLPGFPDVVVSSMNPGFHTNSGGAVWMSRLPGATEGTKSKGYNLYASASTPGAFGKASGFGELVAVCQAAPIEIGNRIWDDLDGDGVQDANEPGIDGVVVQLIAPGGAVIATTTTANGGQYYFSSTTTAGLTPNTNGFIVRVGPGQAPLGVRTLTTANTDPSANGDSRDSDATLVAGNADIVVNTGGPGQNNHTYDIGYTTVTPPTLALGNYVWYDTNDNGVNDVGEQPIDGVDVVLYRDNGDGVFNALTDTVLATQTTVGGLYLFTNLTPGNYFVQIPATEFNPGQTLVGYRNSTGQTVGDINDRDHGTPAPVAGQGIVSDLVTLAYFTEPVNDGDTNNNTNLTIDFGFYRLALGNLVFFDNNNSGVFDAGDAPASGIPVELLNAGNAVIQTTVTDAAGIYGFTDLAPGNYSVRITPPATHTSSTGAANAFEPGPDPDNDVDNDDNGTNTGATITSAQVTLTPGAEPIVTNVNGTSANPTLDFGLIRSALMSLGNYVWRDTNNDGLVSAGETGIDGVTVRLFDGTGTVQLNQMQTGGGGFYLFNNLQPGNYVVEVVTPAGLLSSTGTGTAYEPAPDPDNDINDDDNGTTQGAVVRSLPVTLAFNTEPVNDGDTNDNSNLSVDFGFYSPLMSLGNLVWLDVNNNGLADAGEAGIAGATVRLIGADGTTVLGTTTTNASGNYLFTGLTPGIYYVEVDRTSTVQTGYPSSTDIGSSANPDNDTDNDDNGVNVTASTVRSNAVTLVFNTEPINDGDTDPNSNLTVDFGFVPPNNALLSLGNLVWWDSNKNAVADLGEIGLQGVAVRLVAANGTTVLATTTTDGAGHYRFNNLQPGNYYVEVDAPVIGFSRPSSLDIGSSANPNNDIDNDDNGLGQSGTTFRSALVTLSLNGEPVNDGDTDANSNLTVDFGFIPDPFGLGGQCGLAQTRIPTVVAPNVPFTARYTVENGGPGWVNSVIIEGMLQAGLTVTATAPSTGGTCAVMPGMVECTWPGKTPVGPAGARFVDVTLVADASYINKPVQLWFMGIVDKGLPSEDQCDPVDGYPFVLDNSSAVADLSLTAIASSSFQTGTAITAPANQPMTTRFSVTNTGAVPGSGVYALQLDGHMPLDVTQAALTQGSVAATSSMSGSWDTGPIAPGATAAITITLVPRSGTTTRFNAIRTAGFPADPDVRNDATALIIDGVTGGGGRRVAVGNFDGSAGDEIVTASGPEEGQVRLFTGAGVPVWSFFPFTNTFTGGIRVASCDVNGDGFQDLVMGQGSRGGQVRVVSLFGGVVSDIVTFNAFENTFTGGVNVACADIDHDGRGEVIVAPEGGRAPDVRVFDVDIELAQQAAQFQAYEASFTGGVRIAAANFTGSPILGSFQILTLPGPGRAGEVKAWSVGGGAATLVAGATILPPTGARVALGDANGDGSLDMLLMPDAGSSTLISVYSLSSGALLFSAPSGAAGIKSVDAAVGRLTGGPGVEVVIGRGPGESPDIITFTIGANGVVVPRLIFTALEVP